MKVKLDSIINSRFGVFTDNFCNSVWYVIVIGAICVLSHSLERPVIGAALLTVILVPTMIFCKNHFVFMPFFMMSTFSISKNTRPQSGYFNTPLYISVLCVMLAILVAAFVFNVVYYKKYKLIFKRAYLTVSLLVITFFLLMGGVGSPTYGWKTVGLALSITATMFLPYSLLVNCGEYDKQKTVKMFSYSLVVAATVTAIGFLQQYIIHDFNIDGSKKTLLDLGYAVSNDGAAIIAMALPMTFYLVYTCKHGYLWLIAVAVEFTAIVFTYSRASLLMAIPTVLVLLVALFFKQKQYKLGYRITAGMCLALLLILVLVFRADLVKYCMDMFADDMTGSGRTTLWKNGFESWKSRPMFGLGLNYLMTVGFRYFSFHCTPLTYLYCTGVFGLAAYLYHRYKTVRLVFSAKLTPERIFVSLGMLVLILNALLDVAMTHATHLLYYAIMIALTECDAKETKGVDSLIDKERIVKTFALKKQTDEKEISTNVNSGVENVNTMEGES